MIILSLFSIYQRPVQNGGINLGQLGLFSIAIAIASFVLNLLVVYNLFMGIKDMAEKQQKYNLVKESDEKWNQYKLLQIAILCAFIIIFIPLIGVIYFIAIFVITIILLIGILGFIRRCNEINALLNDL
jgi:predicted Co/Zn/Cd cation transporter (cation efflux family)